MPILHPDPPRIQPHRQAAREVLASLRRLPAEAHLFVHLGIPEGDGQGLGELDFLVLHPELGLVIVELPQPGMERSEDGWVRVREDGTRIAEVETPGAALARKQYLLLNFLKKAGLEVIPPITRILAVPDLPLKPGQSLGPDLPACRILTRAKLRQPFAALQEAVAGGRPWANWRALDEAAHASLGKEPLQALVEILTPVLLPQPHLAALMAAEGVVGDPEAQHMLDHLAHNFSQGRYRVRGAPGSGKSLLARKVTRLWAAEGRRVLVLASTRALAWATRTALDELVRNHQARVTTWEDLAVNLLEDARALPPSLSGLDLAAALARALPTIHERWDALVLDEAQDLEPGWMEPLLGLLGDPARDPVLVLEDPAQNRHGEASGLTGQPWRLDLSLRHGAAIRRATFQAMPACGWALPEEAGDPEALVSRPSSPATWRRDLGEILAGLQQDGLAASQVLILTPHPVAQLGIGHGHSIGPWQVNASAEWWEGAPEQVRLGPVQAFKGLEADAVVYLAPAYRPKDGGRSRYGALSRARQRAIVLDQALEEPLRPHDADASGERDRRPIPAPSLPRELAPAAAAALLASLRS